MKNPESQFGNIDKFISDVGETHKKDLHALAERTLSTIDTLSAEIDQGLKGRKREVAEWSDDQKREFAADGNDPYVLNLLSMDENFNVRTLAFCNPNAPENSMRRALDEAPDYVRMVIANNPNSPSDVLDRLAELTSEPEVLNAVKLHPNVSEVTKYKIENRMA
jgi:hypothetical protein